MKLVGLESFGDHVLQFFCDAIERQYPLHDLSPDTTPYEQGRIVKTSHSSDLFIDWLTFRKPRTDAENTQKEAFPLPLSLPSLFLPYPSVALSSFPLEVGPLNPTRGL